MEDRRRQALIQIEQMQRAGMPPRAIERALREQHRPERRPNRLFTLWRRR